MKSVACRRAIAFAPLFVLIGCRETKLDQKKLEGFVEEAFGTQGIGIHRASCPAGMSAKKGTAFDCTLVDLRGTQVTVGVKVGDDGNITTTNGTDITMVDLAKIGELLASDIKAKVGLDATADCGRGKIICQKGVQIFCKTTLGSLSFTCDETNIPQLTEAAIQSKPAGAAKPAE